MTNSIVLLLITALSSFAAPAESQPHTAVNRRGTHPEGRIEQLEAVVQKSRDSGAVLRARLQLARIYQRQGDWWSAIDQLQAAKKMAADVPEYVYELGTAYGALSRWAFDRMHSIAPQSARTQQLTAEQLMVIGENDRAIKTLQDAIKTDPTLEGSHLALAMVYMRTGKPEDAAAEIELELAIAPQSASARALKQALADRKQ
jgi:tetratricopeptide (TPR) repeat protein